MVYFSTRLTWGTPSLSASNTGSWCWYSPSVEFAAERYAYNVRVCHVENWEMLNVRKQK